MRAGIAVITASVINCLEYLLVLDQLKGGITSLRRALIHSVSKGK